MSDEAHHDLLERYRKLNELVKDLASTLELNTLLNRIVIAAAELSNAEAASILLYDEKAHELRFETTTNLDDTQLGGIVVPVDNSIAGWIVTEQQPVIISDAQQDPRHFNEISEATDIMTGTLLGVPLIAKDKVVGVLEAINKLEGEFTIDDQDILMALGAQAAVAIENSRLFQQSDQISELVHELRTPLTSINMSAQLLLNPEFPPDSRRELVDMILGETRRLTDLATDFLDLSRLETGRIQYQVQDIELPNLLNSCLLLVKPQAKQSNIEIKLDLNGKLPTIRGDYDKIKQVVINLLSNAIKYNRSGGKVILEASANKDNIHLSIQDTGIGIPQESLPHLFEKFYRVPGNENKTTGTGLGLSICQRIITDHGGDIHVQSQQGEGTTFEIILPAEAIPN